MRKSSLYSYLLVFFLNATLRAWSQSTPPIMPRADTTRPSCPNLRPLLEVLIELNKSKGVYFLFSQQPLGKVLVQSPTLSPNIPVEKVLSQMLKSTGLYFKKVDDRTFVILSKKPYDSAAGYDPSAGVPNLNPTDQPPETDSALLSISHASGRVIAADGKTLAGVSVTIKHSHKGTVTDLEGMFNIHAGKGDTLLFSFVGYKARQLPAPEAARGWVIMTPSDQPLTEVLVTALGIKKQERSLGFSATEVDGSRLAMSRDPNLGNALVGQVAGLSVAINATGPYGSSRVLIRGNASLSGNNQPLYVIDGVPYDNTTQGYSGTYGGADLGDGLSNINPDDIESVLVLKGVAASALYGYRGGNGAILITTKSGSKTRGIGIQVNDNLTANTIIDEREYQYVYGQGVSGVKPANKQVAEVAPYYSWGARLDGSQAVNFLGDKYSYLPVKDNFHKFFKTGLTNQSSVALTGANNKGHFRLGISDLYLNTIIPNSSMRQQGLNFNSSYSVTSRLQMDLTADYVFEHVNNRASISDNAGNIIAPLLYLPTSFDVRWLKNRTNADGTEKLAGTIDNYFENPYYIAYDYINRTDRNRITGGLTLKYNLLDWLYLQGQIARDGYIFNVTNIVPSGVQYTRSDGIHGGNLTQYEVNYHELNSSFMIGMHKGSASAFSISANLGGNQQDNVTDISGVGAVPNSPNRPAGPFQVAGNYNASNIIIKPYSSYYRHYRVNSLYGNADLGYKNYLFVNLTARNDWFSTLNINTDHYLYPSISGSFVFSEAWRLPAWISLGKTRASYAASSNGTEPYQNRLTYGLASYTINGQTLGYIATSNLVPLIPNASLRPVSIAEKELGLIMRFLGNRLGFDFTFYSKQTTNDIVRITVSPTSGYYEYIENIGKIRNRGIELLLTGAPLKNAAFSWNISFNLAVNNNKVLAIGGAQSIVISGAYPRWGSEVSISNVVGLPYGQIMGYAYKRDGKGNVIYSDGASGATPAGEPEHTGVVPLGSTVYRQTGGLTNEFRYKDLSLSALVDFKFGAKLYSGTNLLLYQYGLQKKTLEGREGGYIGNGVTADGHRNTRAVPAQRFFQDISAGGTNHIAEEFVYDASFVKLRSMALSYYVPASRLRKGFIKGMGFSLIGRNLLTLMKHTPNIDPESSINSTNGQGLELSGYPPVRSWGFNINMKF
ncbi:SusC/RagA family TonB-linked outer membrane protein [Flavitalea sp. BT771]|uniref:SusC/RagA family TonB-linked outer membrane protein n=1 Tax=Flavitalea sp. BT771 TaxID=3063329 RepID=UPI0026E140B1|nr:SusC/RagA family TonB-linked outer membrane protein [Flavitalea sp. BT771]MDO6431167.1 SusC/RagA family TonB-linked outer membrane protein [Flavitalea sp. BT771]MDV6220074.1 SusC/RagA family TonB-linked outer membrane protein [Flavitalea sp. BT771]